ncbi:MAG: hypothetical protein IJS04_04110 [Muribaculaceae bacterium]|nr:hypothetical protein [Muribaculaceae bacterium]
MTTTINDCRANRNYCFGQYLQICEDVVKSHLGQDREFKGGTMDWNYFKSTSYKRTNDDVQVEVYIDFNLHTIAITTK